MKLQQLWQMHSFLRLVRGLALPTNTVDIRVKALTAPDFLMEVFKSAVDVNIPRTTKDQCNHCLEV